MSTNEDRLSFDDAVEGLNTKFATLGYLLALSLLFDISLAVLLYQIPNVLNGFFSVC
jgi:hypothetical protein